MADQKVSALSAIPQADVDDTLLLYVVDVTGGTVSRKVTKANLFAGTVKTQLTLVMPSGPVGSSSAFVGGINIPSNSLTFSTAAQTGDYSTNFIGQATLVDGTGSGTITNAASIDIVGAPIASTGVTITNNYALRVRAGTTLLQAVTGAGVFTSTGGITMSSSNITLAGNKILTTNYGIYDPNVADDRGANYLQIYNRTGSNVPTVVGMFPGTSNNSSWFEFNRLASPQTTNFETFRIGTDSIVSGEYILQATADGTGTNRPIRVYMESTIVSAFLTNNDVQIGSGSAISTSATGGFLIIPSCAGTPTGVPTNAANGIPLVYDTTNHRLYIYEGGAWHYIARTA